MTLDTQAPPPAAAGAVRPRRRRPLDVVIALAGELLLTLGVLLGLFVVWELYWTDFVAERQQTQIVHDLDFEDTDVIDAIAAGDVDALDVIPAELQMTTDAPVMDEPAFATTFATMYVPRWGADYVRPVSQGIDKPRVLNTLGIGHYPGTAMPGDYGNFSLAGHRTTYGKPFNAVADLQVGDALVIHTADAWYVYSVDSWQIVNPSDVDVIAPVPGQPGAEPDDRYITLTTCHPMYSAAQRWIVHGTLDYWAATGNGVPPELVEAAS